MGRCLRRLDSYDMHHLDLFSGIGGNSIAADWVWPDVQHTFCEINPFCRNVLRMQWPDSVIYEDIKKLNPAVLGPIDLLTAGVPCQPASAAGKRRGTEDDRWLWPRALEILFATRPRYAIFENPPGILTLQRGIPFRDILSQMGDGDYETLITNIPACGVEAPHERQRVFIIAHDTRQGKRKVAVQRKSDRQDSHTHGSAVSAPDTLGQKIWSTKGTGKECEDPSVVGDDNFFAPDLGRERSERRPRQPRQEKRKASVGHFNEPWLQVVDRLCNMVHGLPRKMVQLPDGTQITEAKWRQEVIAAAGNAVVPAQVEPIMKAIKEADEVV